MAGMASPRISGAICISGIYPHLAVFNGRYVAGAANWEGTGGECGIGAVVPWAGRLWLITYPPHATQGSPDKLWSIDKYLTMEFRPESVGGTHACRMVHRESNQLIIGPYFIDAAGKVRAADIHNTLIGRMTGVARHLTDPSNLVYFYDMEGAVYEVNVHTLAVKKLFDKPAPGDHGKGAYTGQGRLIVSNNGEKKPKEKDQYGALAEWDGREWRVVERKQFTDVTGLGGIYGSPDGTSPIWAMGWDRRSVILKLLDGGAWSAFRLPKASHCFDPAHGWYTEWPRIREVAPGRLMMDMHHMFFDFPKTFSAKRTGGIRPIASHLRYIPDFCEWNGKLVLAADDASVMQNPLVGKAQSNLWFGSVEELKSFGPRSGWGGPWVDDAIKADAPSDPFLVDGFDRRCVHFSTSKVEGGATEVVFTIEADRKGDGDWRKYRTITVPGPDDEGSPGYRFFVFPADFDAAWVRFKADRDCRATAYLHNTSSADAWSAEKSLFASLSSAGVKEAISGGLIRPAAHNTNLQFTALSTDERDGITQDSYYEVDQTMRFTRPAQDRSDEVRKIAPIKREFAIDDASAIMTWQGATVRLPKGDAACDMPFAFGWPRAVRECVSERYLVNIHGTFYEMPRDQGLPLIKPVCTHNRQIMDFCTWRGLMVISGNLQSAKPNGNYFASSDGRTGLWFGAIDDLWKLGKPVGHGGPWRHTAVQAGVASDPYLMTGYDRKRVELSHDASVGLAFAIEVDFCHKGWSVYKTLKVPPGRTLTHVFPDGFSAHWVRLRTDRPCVATVTFVYE